MAEKIGGSIPNLAARGR